MDWWRRLDLALRDYGRALTSFAFALRGPCHFRSGFQQVHLAVRLAKA